MAFLKNTSSSVDSSFQVKGLAEMNEVLDTFEKKLRGKAIGVALKASGALFRDLIKELVPQNTGALRRSVRTRMRTKAGEKYIEVVAGGKRDTKTKRIVFYAHLVEFGVAPHLIEAVNAHFLKLYNALGGDAYVMKVNHPGMQMQPFMRTGIDMGFEDAVVAFRDALRDELKEALEAKGIPSMTWGGEDGGRDAG